MLVALWWWLQFCKFLIVWFRSIKAAVFRFIAEGAAWLEAACSPGDVVTFNNFQDGDDLLFSVYVAGSILALGIFVAGFALGRCSTRTAEGARAPPLVQEATRLVGGPRATTPPQRLLARQLTDPPTPSRTTLLLATKLQQQFEAVSGFPVPLASPRVAPQAGGGPRPLAPSPLR